MTKAVTAIKITQENFAPYGHLIEKAGSQESIINDGKCIRHHDLVDINISGEGEKPIVSIFSSEPCQIPLEVKMVERHPYGSQAFIPMHDRPFLVVVCKEENGVFSQPIAFITEPGQGVNINAGQWHGTLTPLYEHGDFLVIDRSNPQNNLEVHHFDSPVLIEP